MEEMDCYRISTKNGIDSFVQSITDCTGQMRELGPRRLVDKGGING